LFIRVNRNHTLDIALILELFVCVIDDERNTSFKDAFRISVLRSDQIALSLSVAKQAYTKEVPDRVEVLPKIQTLSLQQPQLFEKLEAGSDLSIQLTKFQNNWVAQLFRPDLMIKTSIRPWRKYWDSVFSPSLSRSSNKSLRLEAVQSPSYFP
jgi:hypothetical protein